MGGTDIEKVRGMGMLLLEGPRLAEGADQYQCRFGFTRWPAASLRRSAEAARLVGSRYLGIAFEECRSVPGRHLPC